jgi:hypothetical protein
MGLCSFFSNIGSNIASGAKKQKNIGHNAATGISSGIASGAKKPWEGVKEHRAEFAGTGLKGAEMLAPHLGSWGSAIAAAFKAVSPHLAKAIGGKFKKGYSLSRFFTSDESLSPSNASSSFSQLSPAHLNQGATRGVKQAIPTSRMPAGFRAKVKFK